MYSKNAKGNTTVACKRKLHSLTTVCSGCLWTPENRVVKWKERERDRKQKGKSIFKLGMFIFLNFISLINNYLSSWKLKIL